MSWDENPALVFDNGTGMFKAGFAGEDAPAVVFPATVVEKSGTFLIGDDCLSSAADIRYPLEHGIVKNWDDLEKVWAEGFKQLKVAPTDQALLITEAALNPRKNREKMLELAFEKFKVPATYVAIQAVLALYSGGKNTGLVVDSGDGITHCVPIMEGHTVRNAILRMETAGRDLTDWMMELITNDCKHSTSGSEGRELARAIKETKGMCFVSENFDSDMGKIDKDISCMDEEYKLPDGKILYIGRPRFACPEAIFQPEIMGREECGIHELAFNSIQKCDLDMRRSLYETVVLSGGSTMFEGFGNRLSAELTKLAPPAVEVRVVSPPERKYSVWMGAAVMASLSTFQQQWVLLSEYEEAGPGIVHRRCDTLVSSLS